MKTRDAVPDDAATIAAIYAYHVRHGTATFDTDAPDEHRWRVKIDQIIRRQWPFIVAEGNERVVGYAYAAQFRDRPAYAATCEDSIYVAQDAAGVGVGTALMTALMERAADAGFKQMIAVVGGGEPGSVALHAKLGFVVVGRLKNVGRKFGSLLDTVYMQSALRTTLDGEEDYAPADAKLRASTRAHLHK